MPTSQNGWSVVESYGPPSLTGNYHVPGTDVALLGGVLVGDVATVLHYVALRFHLEVETLVSGHCWGYNYRPIRGSSSGYSNHASGTAMDLNAPAHPIGVRGTFRPDQVNRIHSILDDCRGLVRWGGDYSGRPDDMHFEINGNAAQIAALAASIRGETAVPGKDEFDDMKFLVVPTSWQVDGKDAAKPVFLVDGLFARWVRNSQELAAVVKRLEVAGLDTGVNPSGDVAQYFSILVGPEPAGTPAAWGRLSGKEAA